MPKETRDGFEKDLERWSFGIFADKDPVPEQLATNRDQAAT